MTTVDVTFRYTGQPGETALHAINAIREVYGIRKIAFKESAQTVTVEYDATRLNAAVVRQLLRRAGLNAAEIPEPKALDAALAQSPASVATAAPAK